MARLSLQANEQHKTVAICRLRDNIVDFVQQCRQKKLRLFIAESCTGGLLTAHFTAFPGVSAVLHGGVVCYANQSKRQLLGVDEEAIAKHGAVSRQVAAAMVTGSLRLYGVDLAVAITGIAGPSGGSAEKPVGLVYLAVGATGREVEVTKKLFAGSRYQIQVASCDAAVRLLQNAIKDW